MSPAPRFSVVIPCWNHARFLPEAVDSLMHQGTRDLEIIVVNDGSPDNTSAVVRELARKHPELALFLLEQPNLGPAAARNAGIAQGTGQWIVTLDSDDILAEGFLAAVDEAARHYPDINVFTGAYKEFGARAGEWKLTRFAPERLMERGNVLSCSPFARTLWERTGGFDSSNPWGAEDWHFWLTCLDAGLALHALPLPMLHYRIHEAGGRMDSMKRQWDDTLTLHYTMLPEIYPKPLILAAHEHLLHMRPETQSALLAKLTALPMLPMPHFWLGLAHEGRGESEAAGARYRAALDLAGTAPAPQKNAPRRVLYGGSPGAWSEPGKPLPPTNAPTAWPGSWQALLRLEGLPAR